MYTTVSCNTWNVNPISEIEVELFIIKLLPLGFQSISRTICTEYIKFVLKLIKKISKNIIDLIDSKMFSRRKVAEKDEKTRETCSEFQKINL